MESRIQPKISLFDSVKLSYDKANMLKNQQEPEEGIMEASLIKTYSSEINSLDRSIIKNYEYINDSLIKMGFNPKQVLHSFLVYKYETVDRAIELLSETNGYMNHDFIICDNDLCFICGKIESMHIQFNINQNLNRQMNPILSSKEIILKTQNIPNESEDLKYNFLIIPDSICEICFSDLPNDSFSLSCGHKFCKECVIEYLNEEIKNSRVLNIKCPYNGCQISFNENTISKLVDKLLYIKYQKFLQREKIRSCPDLTFCPILNCEGFAEIPYKGKIIQKKEDDEDTIIQIKEDNAIRIEKNKQKKRKLRLVCTNGHPFCSLCNQVWHGDSECNEDREIKEFGTHSGFIVKKCPKCKVWTEKNKGCNHMTCKLCNFSWCWLCENDCLPNHYEIPGTPCYNKLYDDETGVRLNFLLLLGRMNPFLREALYVLLIFAFIFENLIHNLMQFNRNEENRERGEPLIHNDGIQRGKVSKLGLICYLFFYLLPLIFIFSIGNCYFILTSKHSFDSFRIENCLFKFFSVMTRVAIWIEFYILGIFLNIIVFIILMGIIFYTIIVA